MSSPTWRKSSYSDNGECVELADMGATIGLRDSKDTAGPVLRLTRTELAAFLQGAKSGEFDDLAG
jgi:Domain of unknown function (DUF397)